MSNMLSIEPVRSPPRYGRDSVMITWVPIRAVVTAAATPAGVPPTTSTGTETLQTARPRPPEGGRRKARAASAGMAAAHTARPAAQAEGRRVPVSINAFVPVALAARAVPLPSSREGTLPIKRICGLYEPGAVGVP